VTADGTVTAHGFGNRAQRWSVNGGGRVGIVREMEQ
jgi:hypothetical protein